MSEGNQKCRKRITMAKKGSSSLEQGKPVSHSETRHLVFFCAHGTYARRRTAKHYEFDGETIHEGENGHPFFWCINTA